MAKEIECVPRNPRVSGEDRRLRSDFFTALIRASGVRPEHARSSMRTGKRRWSLRDARSERPHGQRSKLHGNLHALRLQAAVRQLWPVRSRSALLLTRMRQGGPAGALRRAGRHYQQSARGRSGHALRQARYRARKTSVTHQSGSMASPASPTPACVAPAVLLPGPLRPRPPSCMRCGSRQRSCVPASEFAALTRQQSTARSERSRAVDAMRVARLHETAPPACTTRDFHR